MKKIRVHSVIKGILIFYGIILGLQIIIHFLFKFEIADYFKLHNLITSIVILLLALMFGVISKNDFFKDIEGRVIDKYEIFERHNLTLGMPFIVLSLLQIFISFVSSDIVNAYNLLGLHLKSDVDKFFISTLILYPLPTHIFILRSFFKRSIVNEKELIKINRRYRIRTSEISELKFKVDLEEWFANDPYLQQDKDLFRRLITVDPFIIGLAGEPLKKDKEFILELLSMNYLVGNNLLMDDLDINENDLNDELIVKIADQVLNLQDIFDTHFMVANSSYARTFTKRIIDIKQNQTKIIDNSKIPASVVDWHLLLYVSLKKNRKLPVLESFRFCDNHNHIISIEDSHCTYC